MAHLQSQGLRSRHKCNRQSTLAACTGVNPIQDSRADIQSPPLEADRISFSFYFSAEKEIRIFVFLFFGTKMAVKNNKKRQSVLWMSQCTAGRVTCSRIYSRCLHRHLQSMSIVRQ